MHTLRYQPIPSSFYSSNRDKLAAQLPEGALVVIHANDIYPTNADGTLPHHQNANLFYLTGIDQEETVLLMRVGECGRHQDTLLLRETNPKIVIWEGRRLSAADAAALSGIDDIRWTDEYQTLLNSWLPSASGVWVEQDTHPRRLTCVQTRNERYAIDMADRYPDVQFHSIYGIMSGMRLVKTAEELVQLRRACSVTGEGFVSILPLVRPGVGEWELEAALGAEYVRRRSRKFSFLPIIASGEDTCVLHYISNHKTVRDGDLVLFDIGAEYGGYAGDMTRTVPANGRFTPRQRAVYDAVLAVHRFAASVMRPGLRKSEYERLVRVRMAEALAGLGLIGREEANADDEVMTRAVRRYYMHSTSHPLGLDVHDVGPQDPLFAENQVWTIEPGIYIAEEGIGIRIETDVLVLKDGVEDLIPGAPLEADDIEALMVAK